MEKIYRNDPCPCGSGKKYKRCCGAGEAVPITTIIEGEIDELQKQILHYAYLHFGHVLQDDFESFEEMSELDDEQEREFFEMIHTVWFSLFEGLDDGETIIEKFIHGQIGKIKRPKLKQILQTWTFARTLAGKVISIDENKLTVEDGINSEQLDTIVTSLSPTVKEGSFIIGILVPYDQSFVFFPSAFDLPELMPEHAYSYIEECSMNAEYDSPQEYLTDNFLEVLSELPMIGGLLEIDEIEWPAPVYKEVVDILREKLISLVPPPIVDLGVILWINYVQRKQKRIQNPNLYAAAMHYLLTTIAPMNVMYTQKELAEQYGVNARSISSIVSELDEVLAEDIAQLMELDLMTEENDPSPPFIPRLEGASVIEFPTKSPTEAIETGLPHSSDLSGKNNNKTKVPARKVSKRDEERARNLIYDALQSEGKNRYKLAENALTLNPNCVDAYVILAEKTKSLEDAILMYEKGIQAGERELGKEFFKENKGFFWGLTETRPFMRAKQHYAEALSLLGNVKDAIVQYEELLELNPMDNQGVRYSLFVAYVDAGEYKKARNLLQQYDEASAHGAYNKLLLELSEKGFTKKAQLLAKAAKKENKYVIPYLVGKKRLPAYPPDYYGFGDENEAIVYADMHLHLWKRIDGLAEWLKNK
ncbi:tetratricopeptide (TPR) repeat protein [Bacillus sp. SLBN-46]|uniref:SEC-C metal-binding domain-containing protein n=1 Tax=Bacillus sp. SLBN-46 TaxID=3042283 RepID=UPI0028554A93|nr:SEC-C metal-binding domain-containing protein [Bacillus sp. SLBN-46]MDR6121610.1 tetratricopeptide (TPR) repeat protein [Bacillus sp. SLBN-46]